MVSNILEALDGTADLSDLSDSPIMAYLSSVDTVPDDVVLQDTLVCAANRTNTPQNPEI